MGEKAFIDRKLIGLELIEVLLTNQNREFTGKELRIKAKQISKSEGKFKDIECVDSETIANLTQEKIQCLLDTIKDPAEKTQAKEEIERYKKSALNNKNKPRATDSHRKSVNRAIEIVKERIKAESPLLYNHFVHALDSKTL